MAVVETAKEALWLISLVKKLGLQQDEVVLHCDMCLGARAQTLGPCVYNGCEHFLDIICKGVQAAASKDPRMPASLLRLHFHDCFVNGCDASILLDGSNSEQQARPNLNSIRGLGVIDSIKKDLVKKCPHTHVSCADIIAVAAQCAVVMSTDPRLCPYVWQPRCGRLDGFNSSKAAAEKALPTPFESLSQIKAKFSAVGLKDLKDMVVLSGAHSIGLARCTSFTPRFLKNFTSKGPDSTIDSKFKNKLTKYCSQNQSSFFPLDNTTTIFDNVYFKALIVNNGLLFSDQLLWSSTEKSTTATIAKSLVQIYATNSTAFLIDFSASMIKMGNIGLHIGKNGEIRGDCGKVN
ncbi:peroxidase A2-like [Malania oleifera]|uniref:peroxidase A2-like n=1 Tax=Malania oleifera TaxID=397392 RepID=UPI0025AEC3A5|nr:peroxidase A2-like [Malania oleifera]